MKFAAVIICLLAVAPALVLAAVLWWKVTVAVAAIVAICYLADLRASGRGAS